MLFLQAGQLEFGEDKMMSSNTTALILIDNSDTLLERTTGPTNSSTAAQNEQTHSMLQQVVYYIKLLMFIFGCPGNLFSMATWLTRDFRKQPHSKVFVMLAIVNNLFLIHTFIHSTTLFFDGDSLVMQSKLLCQIADALGVTSMQLDSFLVIYLSVERFVSVFIPHRVKTICTHTKVVVYILIITVTFLVFNITVSVYDVSMITLENGTHKCKVDDNMRTLIGRVMVGMIPLVIIFPCNAITIVKVVRQYIEMRGVIAVTQQQAKKKDSIKASILTLSVTITYILLLIPSILYFLCCRENYFKNVDMFVVFPMINTGINFYLYNVASSEYRRKVKVLLNRVGNSVCNYFTTFWPQNAVEPFEGLN